MTLENKGDIYKFISSTITVSSRQTSVLNERGSIVNDTSKLTIVPPFSSSHNITTLPRKTESVSKGNSSTGESLIEASQATKSFNITNGKIHKVFDIGFHVEYPQFTGNDPSFQTTILNQLPHVSRSDSTRNNFDRLITQIDMMKKLNKTLSAKGNLSPKVVYMSRGDPWEKRGDFTHCPVTNCVGTLDLEKGKTADAVLYVNTGKLPTVPELKRRDPNQVWIMFINECPNRSWNMRNYKDWFNWTLTYRHDAVISLPYFRFNFLTEPRNKSSRASLANRNYAKGRVKKVAWFVSNCVITKSGRRAYATELQKYIDVDIFGGCGTHTCPVNQTCEQMLRKDYKFYLSFENHRCSEYITEKAERPYM